MTTLTPTTPATAAVSDYPDDAAAPPPLARPLRLNLSALGIDAGAPDFNERFFRFANDNPHCRFEYSAQGELIVMPPTGPIGNDGEQGINYGLFSWGLDHPGHTYSQTVQFRLPSGALYLPDASWISQERYDRLTAAEKGGTINGAPDFVVEVHSWSDRLREGLAKMRDWMDGGAKLGWYIHPRRRRVYVYRAGQDDVEILENPDTLSGEDVLPGFVFEVNRLIFARYEGAGV